jgi:D-alanyl-D-alanine carboxypeptidase (penicillin-binding protein 5/6)
VRNVSTEAAALSWGTYAGSAIGAVGFGGVLASSGSEKQLPIASITKIVTALVVLDKHPLTVDATGPTISFTQADVAIWQKFQAINGNVSPVRSGLTLTQRDVLNLVLIESANNYAESLAIWAYGSEAAYLDAAHRWLSKNSLRQTTIADTTVMRPANASTTGDLIQLGKLALANPVVSEIVSTKNVAIPEVGNYVNRNKLVGGSGVRGIKTGTLDEAGACLLFAADQVIGTTPVTVIGVVLGAKNHDELNVHVKKLLGQVTSGLHEVTLATAGEPFARYDTRWGATSRAVASSTLRAVVWSDTPITLFITTAKVTSAKSGTEAGKLHFSVKDRAFTVPLILETAIDDPGPWWRLLHPGFLF